MRVILKRISISVLLLAGMASALVHADNNRDERDSRRAAQSQRFHEGRPPEGEGGRQVDPSNGPDGRKHGRLSPEERRALRRQINEAGQDIYTPRR
jgi:uncharacterized membrane protein